MKIVETARGAMQGIPQFIPTEEKARYINSLLKIGFHTIDFGSFVSHNAIPQMRDTAEVLKQLDLSSTMTQLMVLAANERGAKEAVLHEEITAIGFPFSCSATFAQLNTNTTVEKLFDRAQQIQEVCAVTNKDLVVYISMAFGNPYGEEWNVELISGWVEKLKNIGIKTVQLSDTIGQATPDKIKLLFESIQPTFPEIELGLHIRTEPHLYIEKVEAAYASGCKRFDTVINGMGGLPKNELEHVGNLRTGSLIAYLERQGIHLELNRMAFLDAVHVAKEIFPFVAG